MTAVANAVTFSSSHKIKKKGKEQYSGHIQCATRMRVAPTGGQHSGRHSFNGAPGSNHFYMLEAFKDDFLEKLNTPATAEQVATAEKTYEKRLAKLHVHYLKALKKNRNLVHLGQKM